MSISSSRLKLSDPWLVSLVGPSDPNLTKQEFEAAQLLRSGYSAPRPGHDGPILSSLEIRRGLKSDQRNRLGRQLFEVAGKFSGARGGPAFSRLMKRFNALLARGADPNWAPARDKMTVLHRASSDADMFLVRLMIGAGANLEQPDASGSTALMLAAASPLAGAPAVLDLLLQHKAQANVQNNAGKTPLLLAFASGAAAQTQADGTRVESMQWPKVVALIAAHADVNAQALLPPADKFGIYGDTALIDAAAQGGDYGVTFLLKHGADPFRQDSKGDTALHAAMRNLNLRSMKALLDGIEREYGKAKLKMLVNTPNRDGQTPLMHAARIGDNFYDFLDGLLVAGADKTMKDGEGKTALQIAAAFAAKDTFHQRVVKRLSHA